MASSYLKRTFSTATNRKIWTWSAWVKRHNVVSDYQNALFGAWYNSSNRSVIRFNGHKINFQDSGNSVEILTSRMFRDSNAWYHIVARVDTTQSTASNRVRIYVNGVQETAFDTANYPNQNINMEFQGAVEHYINASQSSGGIESYADMSFSHVHFADGQSLAPTVFGETDSTTGEWKINTSPSFTLGTNGFTILKDGSTYTDQSSNSNNWTLVGTLTKTEDCPSNVFATFNPHANNANATLSNGNTTVSYHTTAWKRALLNFGHTKGKWYWEVKSAGTPYIKVGMVEEDGQWASMPSHEHHADNAYGWAWYVNGGNVELRTAQAVISGYSQSDLGNTNIGNGDILCIALDLDNGRLHARKNDGSWLKSGDPAAGSGGYSIANFTANTKMYIPACSVYNATTAQHNFGNGYFGTTASGIGIVEYDVPTGFTAWSTKGFNE